MRTILILPLVFLAQSVIGSEAIAEDFSTIDITGPSVISVDSVVASLLQQQTIRQNVQCDFQVKKVGSGRVRCFGRYVRDNTGRYYWEVNWPDPKDSRNVDFSNTMAYDNQAYERFKRSEGPGRGERTLNKLDDEPKWGAIQGVGDGLLVKQLKASNVELAVEGEALVDGETCVVLRLSAVPDDGTVPPVGRCFLSLDRELALVRRESFLNGALFSIEDQIEYEWIETAAGDRVSAVKKMRTRQAYESQKYDTTIFLAENIVINADLPDAAYKIDWPEGIKVTDDALGVVFVAGKFISEDELADLQDALGADKPHKSPSGGRPPILSGGPEETTDSDVGARNAEPTLSPQIFSRSAAVGALVIGCLACGVGAYRFKKRSGHRKVG